MKKKWNWSQRILATATVALLVSGSILFAAKGGKGGGKPGGGNSPPPAPVSYYITPVAMPDGYRFLDHNESTAIVGYASDTTFGRRAMAYLPSISLDQGFILDDVTVGVVEGGVDVSNDWHGRHAVRINSRGTIVGELASNDPENLVQRAFLMETDLAAPNSLQMVVLGPFNSNAEREVGVSINDSGDMIVWSDGSLYFGNPGLNGEQGIPFDLIDFTPYGLPNGTVEPAGNLRLTNRTPAGPILVGSINIDDGIENGSDLRVFRLFVAGENSVLELNPIYTDADGNRYELSGLNSIDINDSGDIVAVGRIFTYRKNGALKKQHHYPALWPVGASSYLSLGGDALSSPYSFSVINNDGDAVLNGTRLLHGDWGAENGHVSIFDLIDADDPNRDFYNSTFEITDREATTGWPTIIARGWKVVDGVEQNALLILDPVSK